MALGTCRVAIQILLYRQFISTGSAKYRIFIKLFCRPDCRISAPCFFVTFVAWEIGVTTIEFNRDSIDFGMIMCTASLIVENGSAYVMAFNQHGEIHLSNIVDVWIKRDGAFFKKKGLILC